MIALDIQNNADYNKDMINFGLTQEDGKLILTSTVKQPDGGIKIYKTIAEGPIENADQKFNLQIPGAEFKHIESIMHPNAPSTCQQPDPIPALAEPKFEIYSIAVYSPHHGLGMRTDRHFFSPGKELVFIDGQLHTFECYHRRKDVLETLENIIQQEGDGNHAAKIQKIFKHKDRGHHKFLSKDGVTFVEISGRFYIWHQFYTQKWDAFEVKEKTMTVTTSQNHSKDLAKSHPNNNVSNSTFPNDPDFILSELDLGTQRIRTSWVKMGMHPGSDNVNLDLRTIRDSDTVTHSFQWERSVKMPIDAFETNENKQIVETMLTKVALIHHKKNYLTLSKILGDSFYSRDNLSKYFFTYWPEGGPEHTVSKPGGILEGVTAQNIRTLKSNQYGFKFFKNVVQISPKIVQFNAVENLIVQQISINLVNIAKETVVTINDVFSSTPEIVVFNNQFPMSLEPGKALNIDALLVPETLNLIEGCIYVSFNSKYVFMIPVTAFVIENKLQAKPIYYTDVNVNQKIVTPISLTNTADYNITIIEAYSTEEFVKLSWPNNLSVSSSNSFKDNSNFLVIPAKRKTTVFNAVFETDQLVDHSAMIHLQLHPGFIMRIPIYYHVYPDLVKFLPSIVDFGVIPINFDIVRIPVNLKIRAGHNISQLYLSEVLLPINDERLDFVMGDWDKDPKGNIQIFNKNLERLEEHRRGVIAANEVFHALTVMIKPFKWGLVDQRIKLTFTDENGKKYPTFLPIIGLVTPSNNLVLDDKYKSNLSTFLKKSVDQNKFYAFLPPNPAVVVNVADLVNTSSGQSAVSQSRILTQKSLLEVLTLKDNYGLSLNDVRVISTVDNIPFQYFQETTGKNNTNGSIKYGQFMVNTRDLNTNHGRKYFWIEVNNILIPQYMQITDQKLLCFIEEDFMPIRTQDCESNISLNFGKVGLYLAKERSFNITNVGHEVVQLDWIDKLVQNDELSIEYEDWLEDLLPAYPELRSSHAANGGSKVLIDRYTSKQHAGIFILPGKSITLKFKIEGAISSLQAGKASNVMNNQVELSFKPAIYKGFKVEYTYQVVPGYLHLQQKQVTFETGFVGKTETQIISVKSTYQIPVLIKSIESTDVRILPQIRQSIIEPGEVTKIIDLTFDPSTSIVMESYSLAVKTKAKDQVAQLWQRTNNMMTQGYVSSTQKGTNQVSSGARFNDSSIDNYQQVVSEMLINLNEVDVSLWRNNIAQSKYFSKKKEIDIIDQVEAVITIKTNVVDEIQIPVIGQISKPQILKQKIIDFGYVQVGTYKTTSLKIYNPFNETLYLSLHIGRNTDFMTEDIKRRGGPPLTQSKSEYLAYKKSDIKTVETPELLEDITHRMEFPGHSENFNQKIHRLPDMQNYCYQARLDYGEKKMSSYKQILNLKEQNENFQLETQESDRSIIVGGRPFDIDIKSGDDLHLCNLLQGLIALMPDDFDQSSTWKTLNEYFYQRYEDKLDTNAQQNLNRMQQIQNQIVMQTYSNNGTSNSGFVDPVAAKILNKLHSMYPDSLKVPEQVDIEIKQDIQKCTDSKPFSWHYNQSNLNYNSQLGFPNPFDYGWLGTIKKTFSLSTYVTPILNLKAMTIDTILAKGWRETFRSLTSLSITLVQDQFQYGVPKGYKASAYLSPDHLMSNKRQVQQDFGMTTIHKNYMAAPVLTRQWELKTGKLHEEVLKNNGTLGANLFKQNFFINPSYRGATIKIKPGKDIELEDVVFFEPKTFASDEDEMQMTLYIKSDKAVLQTLPLRGKASSAVLDISHLTKMTIFDGVEFSQTQRISNYTDQCINEQSKNSKTTANVVSKCLVTQSTQKSVKDQIVSSQKSTIPQELTLMINKNDIKVQKEIFDYSLKSFPFYKRMFHKLTLGFFLPDFSQQNTYLVREISWSLSIFNVGDLPITIEQIYFEDPVTGEKSNSQDGLEIVDSQLFKVLSRNTKEITIKYLNQTRIFSTKKNLVLESAFLIQRFPLTLQAENEAIFKVYPNMSPELVQASSIFRIVNNIIGVMIFTTLVVIIIAVSCPKSFNSFLKKIQASKLIGFFGKGEKTDILESKPEEQKLEQSNEDSQKQDQAGKDIQGSTQSSSSSSKKTSKGKQPIKGAKIKKVPVTTKKITKREDPPITVTQTENQTLVSRPKQPNISSAVDQSSSIYAARAPLPTHIPLSTPQSNAPSKSPKDQPTPTPMTPASSSSPAINPKPSGSSVDNLPQKPSSISSPAALQQPSVPHKANNTSDRPKSNTNSSIGSTSVQRPDSLISSTQQQLQQQQQTIRAEKSATQTLSSISDAPEGQQQQTGTLPPANQEQSVDVMGSAGVATVVKEKTTVGKMKLSKKEMKKVEARKAKNQELEEQSKIELAKKAALAEQQRKELEAQRIQAEKEEAERKAKLEREAQLRQKEEKARQKMLELKQKEEEKFLEEMKLKQEANRKLKEAKKAEKEANLISHNKTQSNVSQGSIGSLEKARKTQEDELLEQVIWQSAKQRKSEIIIREQKPKIINDATTHKQPQDSITYQPSEVEEEEDEEKNENDGDFQRQETIPNSTGDIVNQTTGSWGVSQRETYESHRESNNSEQEDSFSKKHQDVLDDQKSDPSLQSQPKFKGPGKQVKDQSAPRSDANTYQPQSRPQNQRKKFGAPIMVKQYVVKKPQVAEQAESEESYKAADKKDDLNKKFSEEYNSEEEEEEQEEEEEEEYIYKQNARGSKIPTEYLDESDYRDEVYYQRWKKRDQGGTTAYGQSEREPYFNSNYAHPSSRNQQRGGNDRGSAFDSQYEQYDTKGTYPRSKYARMNERQYYSAQGQAPPLSKNEYYLHQQQFYDEKSAQRGYLGGYRARQETAFRGRFEANQSYYKQGRDQRDYGYAYKGRNESFDEEYDDVYDEEDYSMYVKGPELRKKVGGQNPGYYYQSKYDDPAHYYPSKGNSSKTKAQYDDEASYYSSHKRASKYNSRNVDEELHYGYPNRGKPNIGRKQFQEDHRSYYREKNSERDADYDERISYARTARLPPQSQEPFGPSGRAAREQRNQYDWSEYDEKQPGSSSKQPPYSKTRDPTSRDAYYHQYQFDGRYQSGRKRQPQSQFEMISQNKSAAALNNQGEKDKFYEVPQRMQQQSSSKSKNKEQLNYGKESNEQNEWKRGSHLVKKPNSYKQKTQGVEDQGEDDDQKGYFSPARQEQLPEDIISSQKIIRPVQHSKPDLSSCDEQESIGEKNVQCQPKLLDLDDDDDPVQESMLFHQKQRQNRMGAYGVGISTENSEEDAFESPTKLHNPVEQKKLNLFSNFKKIKQIFSNTAGQPNQDEPAQGGNSLFGDGTFSSMFSTSGFGNQDQGIFGQAFLGSKDYGFAFKDQNQGSMTVYERPKDSQKSSKDLKTSEDQFQNFEKQPSNLEALRMNSRPLVPPRQQSDFMSVPNSNAAFNFLDDKQSEEDSGAGFVGFSFKKLEPYKPGFASKKLQNIQKQEFVEEEDDDFLDENEKNSQPSNQKTSDSPYRLF